MVKRGCGDLPDAQVGRTCIRDAYLVQQWAVSCKIKLEEMDRNRGEYRTWVNQYTGRPALIFNLHSKERREDYISPKFPNDRDPLFLTACEAVRFRASFVNGKNVYLSEVELPRELRAEEWKELKEQHGYESSRQKKARAARQLGGRRTRKAGDLFTERDIARKYFETRRANPSLTRTAAAISTQTWANKRYELCIKSFKTVLAYAKLHSEMENGKR
jgi:hypothetical protein